MQIPEKWENSKIIIGNQWKYQHSAGKINDLSFPSSGISKLVVAFVLSVCSCYRPRFIIYVNCFNSFINVFNNLKRHIMCLVYRKHIKYSIKIPKIDIADSRFLCKIPNVVQKHAKTHEFTCFDSVAGYI